MTKALFKPYVKMIAVPRLITENIIDFANHHDMESLLSNTETPISRIVHNSLDPANHADLLSEFCGRICYRAFGQGRPSNDYIKNVIDERHGNVFAHVNLTFVITGVSRALSHEFVRHHVGVNPSQESQRFVMAIANDEDTLDNPKAYRESNYVIPPAILTHCVDNDGNITEHGSIVLEAFRRRFLSAMQAYSDEYAFLEESYKSRGINVKDTLIKKRIGEAARCWLPNAIETRFTATVNLRALFNIIERRANIHADLEIRRLIYFMYVEALNYVKFSLSEGAGFKPYTDADGYISIQVPDHGI